MTDFDKVDPEEADDSEVYRAALLNGDERFNKFVKLTDSRFDSQARRTNKLRKELREEMASLRAEIQQLRSDLRPAIELAAAWPYIAGVFGIVGSALVAAYTMGILG